MRVFVTWLAIIASCTAGFSQTGNYFLSHYAPADEDIDHLCFDITQDQRGVLYFANKAGVLVFDGRNWLMTHTPAPIYTVAISATGDVFAGGLSGFGRILSTGGENSYEHLSTHISAATNVFQSLSAGGKIIFLSSNGFFVVNPASGVVDITVNPSKEQGLFKNLFEIEGEVYVSTETDDMFKFDGTTLTRSQLNPAAGEILFAHALPGGKKTLLGTSADRVFIYENQNFTEVVIKDIEYLQTNVLVSGAWINDFLISLGTLRGGVIFINPVTGETMEITNYYTGLPDNEVFAMHGDQKECVWVAHDYGFTRIAPFVPFRTFNHYPGLEGNLLCAYSAGDGVYVGTSLGLFKLVKDEIFEEEEYFVTRKRKTTVANSSQDEEPKEITTQNVREKAKRGLFGMGKKRNKKEEAPPPASIDKKTQRKPAATKTVNTRERRTRKVLKSLQYRYAKVEGINGKITELMNVDGQLMAAGLGGVFIIEHLAARPVTSDPVRSMFRSPSLNQIFISTYNEEIKSFGKNADSWHETHLLDTLQEYVSYIFEDKLQNLWLCGRAGVLKVEMIDNEITNIEHVPYLKPSIDETVGLAIGSDVYVVNAGEFQLYDHAASKFVKYDSLPGTRKYFASAGSFWFHDSHRWRTIDQKLTSQMQLDWLGLFSDIRYLTATGETPGLWVITANNELYRFTPIEKDRPAPYPLFLKGIKGPEAGLARKQKLEIEEDQGALTFEFIQPNYFGHEATEYRYLLGGMTDVWSAWSRTNNEVTFPYLPSGNYEIQVQSKDIFGKVSELDKIFFSVNPPYWRQPWFYAMEVGFFGMLVLLSVRLSISNERYRPISRVLSLLTVIIFIQLVQTSVYSMINLQSSPVIEFLIQVFIAFLVLPLEVRVRNLMQRASEGNLLKRKVIEPVPAVDENFNDSAVS
jgi:hypothetical protein